MGRLSWESSSKLSLVVLRRSWANSCFERSQQQSNTIVQREAFQCHPSLLASYHLTVDVASLLVKSALLPQAHGPLTPSHPRPCLRHHQVALYLPIPEAPPGRRPWNTLSFAFHIDDGSQKQNTHRKLPQMSVG